MLTLKNISLMRTTSYYRGDTLKGLITGALSSPFEFLTGGRRSDFFLKDVSFSVGPGERVALLGKNASGKSTLCRLIAGNLFASSGNILNQFQVSLFAQIEHSFFRELSGKENLRYFIRFLYPDLGTAEKERLLLEAAEFSELGTQLDRQVETYSSGQVSRLALALILSKKHDLLILDELQSNADLGFRQKVAERQRDVIRSANSVIVVSHHPEDLSFCSRGLVLDGGQLVFDGDITKAMAAYRLLNS